MTRYEELKNKAEQCRQTSIKAESETMKRFWIECANKLEDQAKNMPLTKASKSYR